MNTHFNSVIMAAGNQDNGFKSNFGIDKNQFVLVNGNSLLQESYSRYFGTLKTRIVLGSYTSIQQNDKTIPKDVFYQIVGNGCKGALASLLLSIEGINSNEHIAITPSDGFVPRAKFLEFVDFMIKEDVDCGILVFSSNDPEFSYVRTSKTGDVLEIAEKNVISDLATAGIYYFRNVDMLLDCGNWAIINNVSFNGDFYISPSLNYFVTTGMKMKTFKIFESDYVRFSTSEQAIRNQDRIS